VSSGYVIPIDPAQIAQRFAAPDTLLQFFEEWDGTSLPEQLSDDTPTYEERIAPLLPRIPDREADLIELYFVNHKRQADIAIIFGITQAAVSYRLDRGIKRIRFLLSIPAVTESQIREDLPLVFKEQIDIDILVGMWRTTCQSEVATSLGLTQGRVRHRFFRAVAALEVAADENPTLVNYYSIFSAISSKKFNILREVKLPQWAGRGGDECI
jgi:DNA-directed RNA polymerase specialized sigma24 family protein